VCRAAEERFGGPGIVGPYQVASGSTVTFKPNWAKRRSVLQRRGAPLRKAAHVQMIKASTNGFPWMRSSG
jgi:hypothetical protein